MSTLPTTTYTTQEIDEGRTSLIRKVRLDCLGLPVSSIEVDDSEVVRFLDNESKGKPFKIGDYL